jgi:hypothetical protein
MAVREYYGARGTLQQNIAAGSAVLQVNPNLSGAIAATFVNGADKAFFSLQTANFYELVQVIAVNGDLLTVVRAQGGTVAQAFPIGTEVVFQVTSAAIIEEIGAISTTVTLTGSGLTQITPGGTNVYNINIPVPNFSGDGAINVIGTYPDIQFTYTREPDDCCGDDTEGSTGQAITTIVGEGLVTAFVNGDEAIVRVTAPVFTAGAGVSIIGAWPNYTISATSGSGTVSSVGVGAGLTLTGSPTVNPTLSITNTGVVAGTYGSIAINSRGQITAVPVTLNPVSIIVAGAGLGYSRTGDSVTLTPAVAAVGVAGIVALADETDPFDPLDNTTAATPAVVALALESLVTADVLSASSYNGEIDADYTNLISGSNVAVTLGTGQKALVSAEVVMVDGTTPLTPVAFGIGVFSTAPARINSNRKVTQSIQNMQFTIVGPFTGTLGIATTAVPVGASVTSYSLNVVTF